MDLLGTGDSFDKSLRSRALAITILVFAAFLVLVVRLWYLQIVQGGNLRALAENNRLRQVTFPDFRGNIFDRNGIELVSSRPAFDIVLIREDIPKLDDLFLSLEKLIPFDKGKVKMEIMSIPAFEPYVIAHDISRNIAAKIEEHRYELPGVSLGVKPIRVYRYNSFATHLIGYLGEISPRQLKAGMFQGYKQGDIIGKYGVEKVLEPLLRGSKGKKIIEVNATGRELNVVKKFDAGAGKDIFLSLDFNAQVAAEKAMEGKRGAVVALKPSTGEVLVMVSSPGFDLNQFADGVDPAYWKSLLKNRYHPLNNRAIQGLYPPASTYKILVALAGLEEGVIDEDTAFTCSGKFKLGKKVYRCWNKYGHGKIKLKRAIEQSCDIYFYNLGLKLGVDGIASWAKKFGLGRITGIALEHEKSGLIPTRAWKSKHRHEEWIKGETLSTAIGQGFNLVTPLQMASLISSFANGGQLLQPQLLKLHDSDADMKELGLSQVPFIPENLEKVQDALYGVVNRKGGTGRRARIKGYTVAGKTGTAQVVGQTEVDLETDKEDIPEKFRDHAWFIGYAPYEAPEIAVAVIVEHAGHGGSVAAPVAQKVMKSYLESLKARAKEATNKL